MGLARRDSTPECQRDLFGDEAVTAPAYEPKLEHVLNRLVEMVAAMRAAEAWPWDEVQLELYRNHVWPHLLKHLPEAEALRWTNELAVEAARLDEVHAT
jgi:hypothetical protein